MAFGLQYLQRVEVTPNLDKTLNPGQGQDAQRSPAVWTYNASSTGSNESSATVQAGNYFLGAYGYLTQGDMIYIYTNDPAAHILWVSAAVTSSTVTTTQLA